MKDIRKNRKMVYSCLSHRASTHFQCFLETLKGSVGTEWDENKSTNQNAAYVCLNQ